MKFSNKDFIKILKPIHKNHTKTVYTKLIKKIYSLRQSLIKRSREHEAPCDINVQEIRELFKHYYGKKCKYCGIKTLTVNTIACDHIIPLSKNGTSNKKNLQLICKTCNIRKGALLEDDFLLLLNTLDKLPEEIKLYVLRKLSKGGKF